MALLGHQLLLNLDVVEKRWRDKIDKFSKIKMDTLDFATVDLCC
jgi:hypothetical protein